jgi:hypothetical protein
MYLCCPDREHSYAYESQCLNVFQNIDESYVTATNVAMHYSVPSAIYNDAVSSAEIVSDVCQCNDPSNAIYNDGAISAETVSESVQLCNPIRNKHICDI